MSVTDSIRFEKVHRSSTLNPCAILSVAILVVIATHLSEVGGDYVLDDISITTDEALSDFFALNCVGNGNRAIVRGNFSLQFATLGDSALASYIVNITVHAINTLLVYWVVFKTLTLSYRQMTSQVIFGIAVAVAFLWGLHPLSTSAVVYVAQRFESVATMFILLSLGSFLAACETENQFHADRSGLRRSYGWYLACAVSACLAYGSKEISAGLPLMLLVAERTVLCGAPDVSAGTSRSLIRRLLPWALMLPVVYGAWKTFPTLTVPGDRIGTAGYDLVGIDPVAYITSQPLVYLRYLQLSVFPVGQVLDYGWLPFTDPFLMVCGTIGWVVLLGFCGFGLWKRSLAGFVLACVLLILAPTSFIPLTDLIFEHRFYLPLASVIGAIVVACVKLGAVATDGRSKMAGLGRSCSICCLGRTNRLS